MSLSTRLVLWLISAVFSALMGIQSLARFGTFHNRTYDLALYARQAWGLAHGEFWDPIVNVHFLGTHIALVLWPLGVIGRLFGTVPVLLAAQALAFGLATLPLAQIGARRFGDAGALCGAMAFLLHPNLGHVATYEFHPGSIAVLPLALALDALDARRNLAFVFASLALLACRADFALLGAALGVLGFLPVRPPRLIRPTYSGRAAGPGALRTRPFAQVFDPRRSAVAPAAAGCVLALSIGYLALQFLVLKPHFWSHTTSYDLHFGPWGGSPFGIVRALFRDPAKVWAHLSEPRRLSYLPHLLWPFAFLPLLAPRWLLLVAPIVALNLISGFPTSVEIYSHYLTPIVPPLVAAGLDGLSQLARRSRLRSLPALGLGALLGLSVFASRHDGALPWSRQFDVREFSVDAFTRQAARVVGAIDAVGSVQAPDPLLPHLAERSQPMRSPPPDRAAEFVVLDVSHRGRYAQAEDLLRTIEEPLARSWLARRDYGLLAAEPSLLLFARGADPRGGPAARFLTNEHADQTGIPLTRCLSVLSAWLDPHGLELELAISAPCPNDLALRIGTETRPKRVDLLFDGQLSPSLLRDEIVLTWHTLNEAERARILERGLRVGALRSNGETPEQLDPASVPIPLVH